MNILINASNLSGGGGAQVCDSICRYLVNYPQHRFTVVLSKALETTAKAIENIQNVKVVRYSCSSRDLKSFLTFRIPFLDKLVDDNKIDCVFTVFGPIKWHPRCPHICGFGLSHIVMPESPYFKQMGFKERLKWKKTITVWKYIFRKSADIFITENPLITDRLQKLFPNKKVVTITNNYNQVFDQREKQKRRELPLFDGISLLSVATAYPHKNLQISIDIAKILRVQRPDLKFRFVLTVEEDEFRYLPDELKTYFLFLGKVDISECPSLYEQCDIVFVPTLLECFTATYPEAMRMKKPIITTNLSFAHGLCGEAALYYESTNAQAAVNTILLLVDSQELRKKLETAGTVELKKFDTSLMRVDKVIKLCESLNR